MLISSCLRKPLRMAMCQLTLVHLRVSFTTGVLGGAGRCYQRGIDHRTLAQQEMLVSEDGIDQGQNLQTQLMRLEQAAESQDRALIGHGGNARIQSGEAGKHRVSYRASSIAGSERLNHCCSR